MRLILFGYVVRTKKSLRKIISEAIEKGVPEHRQVFLHEMIGVYNASLFICIYPVSGKWKRYRFFSNNRR